ncbi:unnamed protein product, partial [marine sediment metagenome]
MVENGEMQFLDRYEAARRAVDELKVQGADVMVAITHSGVDEVA